MTLDCHITTHAVAQAYERLNKHYRATRDDGEDMIAWLKRLAEASLREGYAVIHDDCVWHRIADVEMRFICTKFGMSMITVLRNNHPSRTESVQIIRRALRGVPMEVAA